MARLASLLLSLATDDKQLFRRAKSTQFECIYDWHVAAMMFQLLNLPDFLYSLLFVILIDIKEHGEHNGWRHESGRR